MSVLVEIPTVVASHVLGGTTVILGEGDLILARLKPQTVAPSSHDAAATHSEDLVLAVGKAAFPLHEHTIFGTLAGDKRTYVFTPEMQGEQGGYVTITLPEGVLQENSTLVGLQERFEEVLIDHGLLKDASADAGKGEGDALGVGRAKDSLKRAIGMQQESKGGESMADGESEAGVEDMQREPDQDIVDAEGWKDAST